MWHWTCTWHLEAVFRWFVGGLIVPNYAYFWILLTIWSRGREWRYIDFIIGIWWVGVWRHLEGKEWLILGSSTIKLKLRTEWTEDELNTRLVQCLSCKFQCFLTSNNQRMIATKTHVIERVFYLQCGLFDLNRIPYHSHHHAPSDQLSHCPTSHLVQSSKLNKVFNTLFLACWAWRKTHTLPQNNFNGRPKKEPKMHENK